MTLSNLLPRKPLYYRVVIPANATSWRAKLTTLAGESMLVMMTNAVPSLERPAVESGKRCRKLAANISSCCPFLPEYT